MIASGDRLARNAFRVGLQEEPSRPNVTQELDPSDILEVQDVAAAIARAEQIVRERSSGPSLDVFDRLLARKPATDDVTGHARHARVVPTPVPIALGVVPPNPPIPDVPRVVVEIPAAPPLPVLSSAINEDDAYYHPGRNIRTLADPTLEIHRPEPTMMMRIRARRGALSWVVVAVLAPLAGLAAFGLWLGTSAPQASVANKPRHVVHAPVRAAAPVVVAAPAAPSLDVKSLPTAKR